MKKLLGITGVIALGLLLNFCFFNKKTIMTIENKSELYIDSATFNINNYNFSIKKIPPKETVSHEIWIDSIQTNKHDITIKASIYSGGKIVATGFSYNDLSGSVFDKYTLTLNNDMTTRLK